MTKQSHAKECDINQIMKKFQKTGVIDHIRKNEGQYGEYDAQEYKQAMDIVAEGQSMFQELPSKARQHFDNDPAKFMETVNSPDGINTLRKLGLAYGEPALERPQDSPEPQNTNSGANDDTTTPVA